MHASVRAEDRAIIHSMRARTSWGGFDVYVDFEVSAAPGRRILVVATVYDRKGTRLFETSIGRTVGDRPLRDTCELHVDARALRQGLPAGRHYVTYATALFMLGCDGRRAELARSPFGVYTVSFGH